MVLIFQGYATAQQATLDIDCGFTVEHLRAVTTFAGVHDRVERIEKMPTLFSLPLNVARNECA